MLFSEFAKILYKNSDTEYKPHQFVLLLFDSIVRSPKSDDELKAAEDDLYNPFSNLKPDTLDRIFHGTNPLNPTKVRKVISLKDTHKFAKYISELSGDNQLAIENELKKINYDFDEEQSIEYVCADLFVEILDDIYEGRETSSIKQSSNLSSTHKMTSLPQQVVFYNKADGKLHIGSDEISIPKEIEPPQDIAQEEEKYVSELLAAYGEAVNTIALTRADLEVLPKKYKRNFEDQRVNYYSAMRVDRFVRESFYKGEECSCKWKSETHDYIKDTLWDDYDHGYKRLLEVLKKVVDCTTTSVIEYLDSLVGPKEKKGVCHLLVNDGEVKWVIEDE